MPIQNVSNLPQVPPPARVSNERHTGDGAPGVVVIATSTGEPAPAELTQVAAKPPAQQQPTAPQLQKLVDNINKALKQSSKNLEFTIDTDTMKSVVKLVDSETGDVIRQFPSEETIAISRSIERIQQGLLLRQKA